jgi:tetratricopeptide (TPR) repeat protein
MVTRIDEAIGVLLIACAVAQGAQRGQAYEAGVRAENAGRWDEAVSAYSEVLRVNPQSTGALRRRGSTYLKKGDLRLAARDLEEAGRLSASDGEVWKLLGDARLGLKEYAQAVVGYQNALAARLETAAVYRGLADAYAGMGVNDKALEAYGNCIRMRLDNPQSYLARGRFQASRKKYLDAIEDYSGALALQPDLADAYFHRGYAQGQLEKFDLAVRDLGAALKLRPDKGWPLRAEALLYHGAALDVLGKQEEALANYGAAIESDSSLMRAYLARSDLSARQGKHEAALADRQAAVGLEARNPTVYLARGGSYHSLGRHEEGLADRTKAIELDPGNAQAWYARGSAYFLLKRYEQARLDLEQAYRLAPGNAEVAEVLEKTMAAIRQQETEAAAIRAKAAAAASPEPEAAAAEKPVMGNAAPVKPVQEERWAEVPAPVAAAKEAMAVKSAAAPSGKTAEGCHKNGRALLAQGKPEAALVELACAVELNPKLALAWNALGYAKMLLGRYMDSVRDFDRALEINPNYENARSNKEAAFRMLNRR